MQRHRWWIGLLISLVFLGLFFFRVDPREIAAAISRASYDVIIPALVAYFVGLGCRAFRWQVLLRPVRGFRPGELFGVLAIGYLVNNVFPARVGEIARAVVLGDRGGVSKTSILATIAIERIFDGLALLLIMGVVSLLVPLHDELTVILRIGGAIFVGAALAAIVVVLARGPALRLADQILRILPAPIRIKAANLLSLFLDGLEILRSPRAVGLVLFWSILAWLAEGTMYYIVSLGFSVNQPVSVVLLMNSVANLATAIPSGPGGIGTFDAVAKWILELFGTSADEAVAYTIVLHVALWVPVSLLGLLYLWRDNLALNRLMQRSTAPATE